MSCFLSVVLAAVCAVSGEVLFTSDWHLRPDRRLDPTAGGSDDFVGFTSIDGMASSRDTWDLRLRGGALCTTTNSSNMFFTPNFVGFSPTLRGGTLAVRLSATSVAEFHLTVSNFFTLAVSADDPRSFKMFGMPSGRSALLDPPSFRIQQLAVPMPRDASEPQMQVVMTWSNTSSLLASGLRVFLNENATAAFDIADHKSTPAPTTSSRINRLNARFDTKNLCLHALIAANESMTAGQAFQLLAAVTAKTTTTTTTTSTTSTTQGAGTTAPGTVAMTATIASGGTATASSGTTSTATSLQATITAPLTSTSASRIASEPDSEAFPVALVGGVVGGVIAAVVLGAFVAFLWKRRSHGGTVASITDDSEYGTLDVKPPETENYVVLPSQKTNTEYTAVATTAPMYERGRVRQ
jgi:hypothetical protein